MEKDYSQYLNHPDPRLRSAAAFDLRHSYDEAVGNMIVEAAIKETEMPAFIGLYMVVKDKWTVRFENVLMTYPEWPLAPNVTVWFAIRAKCSHPSYERYIEEHLKGDDWLYKCAAAIYVHRYALAHHWPLCREACTQLLEDMTILERDWDALARSTGLTSVRRLKQKIERVIRDLTIEPMDPRDLEGIIRNLRHLKTTGWVKPHDNYADSELQSGRTGD